MDHPEFKGWPSIQRLSSETMYITEKIDGTNGIIHVSESGTVLAGSRNRWLSQPDGSPPSSKSDDNFGFAQWVYENTDGLRRLGPGYHYGEWYGSGIQRRYGLSTRQWCNFAYYRTDSDVVWQQVPLLYSGPFSPEAITECVERLRSTGSVLVPGFMDPEGVVVTFKHIPGKFKKFCKNDALHKFQQADACQTP